MIRIQLLCLVLSGVGYLALERLRTEHFDCAEVGRLLHFIENSKRGFCR